MLAFSFAASAASSLLTCWPEVLDLTNVLVSSWRIPNKDRVRSSKNRSPPCLAINETETGHFS